MLDKVFDSLAHHLGANTETIGVMWQELESAYSGPKRFYHNLGHLRHMYQLLEPQLTSAQNPDALLIALFYHDAVYNPRRTNNELKSANLLSRRLVAVRQPESFIETAMGLILATQTHDARGDHDTALFLDADLAILGSAHPEYVQYAEAIRKEFSMFPDWIYRPARTKVLQRFLARPAIFLSPVFYPQFEATARQNLEWEIGQLHHG